MMKYVLVLVLLLHLCYSVKLNRALNKEIIKGLENLETLYKNKSNITLPHTMRMPSTDMLDNASSCVGVFIRELGDLLNNVTVPENRKNILKELKANLHDLGPHEECDQICRMIESTNGVTPFSPYANFLRRLNRAKKR